MVKKNEYTSPLCQDSEVIMEQVVATSGANVSDVWMDFEEKEW